MTMNNVISISDLKANPAKAISSAEDLPLAVMSRNKTKAYLLSKDMYEKLIEFIEDYVDLKAVEETDFSDGKDVEDVMKELGL